MSDYIEKARKLGIEIPAVSWEDIDRDIRPVLTKMEESGVKLNLPAFEKLSLKLSRKLASLEKEICDLAGKQFNVNSPSQLATVLFEDLALPTESIKRIKTGLSTSASELRKIQDQHPIIKHILEYREIAKLITTYLKPLPLLADENSRLHTHYGLETATSRLTSYEPNLQNIPIKGTYGPEIRQAFVASEGMKLISADYSQIELRIAAALSGDTVMLDAFKHGEDIHSRVASEVFAKPVSEITHSERRIAKIVNFGILYGVSAFGLAQQTGLPQDQCHELISRYFEAHLGIKQYIDEMSRLAKEQGYVETLFGFRRELYNIHSTNHYLAEADERIATNTPIQGTAAELLKLAMIKLDKELAVFCHSCAGRNLKIPDQVVDDVRGIPKIIMTIHDEIVVEAPAAKAKEISELVEKVMTEVVKLPIPLEVTVGVGDNWGETK